MTCVNLSYKDPKWKCMDCAGRATSWILTSTDLQEQERQEKADAPTLQNQHVWLDMIRRKAGEPEDSEMLK